MGERTDPSRAGVDTTTGFGCDSLFDDGAIGDYWKFDCLATVIDVLINHHSVTFPLASAHLAATMSNETVPDFFTMAHDQCLLQPKTDITGEDVHISSTLLEDEYLVFKRWSVENRVALARFLEYHFEVPAISNYHSERTPTVLVRNFWRSKDHSDFERRSGVAAIRLEYGFDVFVRALRYHEILGCDTAYFPHPVRERAFARSASEIRHQESWSWGRCLLQLCLEGRVPLEPNWILERTSLIRQLTQQNEATWYDLSGQPLIEQRDVVSSIAAEADLPGRVNDRTQRLIKLSLGAASAATGLAIPVVGVVLASALVGVEAWSGNAPSSAGRVPLLRGQLAWPGLMNETL